MFACIRVIFHANDDDNPERVDLDGSYDVDDEGIVSLSSSASSIHRSIDPSIYRRNDRLINVLLDQSIYWSVVRSLDRSICWYIDLSIYWYILWAFDRCTDPSIYRSFNPSIVRLIYWSIDQSIHRSIVRSIYGSNPRTERSYIEDWRTLKAHASGVLGFSFACGQRPQAKLKPRTERS